MNADSSVEPIANKFEANALVFEKPFEFKAPIRPAPIRLVRSPLPDWLSELKPVLDDLPRVDWLVWFKPAPKIEDLRLFSSLFSFFDSNIGTSFNKL